MVNFFACRGPQENFIKTGLRILGVETFLDLYTLAGHISDIKPFNSYIGYTESQTTGCGPSNLLSSSCAVKSPHCFKQAVAAPVWL